MPTTSIDDVGLAQGLARARPAAAVPLDIPLVLPQADPDAPVRQSDLEILIERREKERTRQLFLQQKEAELAREAEIVRRESEQRARLRQAIGGGEPQEPRVTSKTPEWEKSYKLPEANRPSSATPAPTPKTSGAGASTLVDQLPSTGELRSAPNPTNPTPQAKPASVPAPGSEIALLEATTRNAAIGGVASAGIDFVYQVATGTPVLDAAGHATAVGAGTAGGTIIGSAIGTTFGPVGTFVGGMVGGTLGGIAGGAIYDLLFGTKPKSANLPSEAFQGKLLFTGGQSDSVGYSVRLTLTGTRSGATVTRTNVFHFAGPLAEVKGVYINPTYFMVQFKCRGFSPPSTTALEWSNVDAIDTIDNFSASWSLAEMQRLDGKPDTGGNPPALPIPQDPRPPESINHPLNQSAPPRAVPSEQTNPAPNNYAPGGLASRSNGTPRGDSPNWVPHARPKGSLHPDQPQPLIPPLPNVSTDNSSGAPSNGNLTSPLGGTATVGKDGTVTFTAPGSSAASNPQINQSDVSIPATNATTGFSSNLSPDTATPSALPTTSAPKPEPDATRKIPAAPQPQPSPQPVTQTEFKELEGKFDQIIRNGAILAGLTPIIQQIAQNTTEDNLKKAANNGTCEAFAPNGCAVDIRDNAKASADNSTNNGSKLDGLNALMQGLDLHLLKVIDDKLGAQVPGGISGFLTKAFQATRLDKIINALTLITVLHNAAMLSRSLGSTLGDLTGQALSVIGIKDENGGALDINAELGRQVNNLMSTILGAETWAGTKLAWNKANTILSSASQIVYTVRGLFDSGREITEWIANNTGKIGNALKRFRVVGENAYPHMAENVNHQNAWMLKVQKYREGVDTLDDAASSLQGVLGEVQNIQQEAQELSEQKTRFDNAIKDAQPKAIPDNNPIKDKAAVTKTESASPSNQADVFRGEGESSNA